MQCDCLALGIKATVFPNHLSLLNVLVDAVDVQLGADVVVRSSASDAHSSGRVKSSQPKKTEFREQQRNKSDDFLILDLF
jgi:hypothetical protein